MQTYLNNQKDRDVYGTSFITYKDITEDLCIDAHRIKWLGDILEANGLLTKENVRRGTGRQVKYRPRYFILKNPTVDFKCFGFEIYMLIFKMS